MTDLKPWPDDWPQYQQGQEPCDTLVGPCVCGAWHEPGEFRLKVVRGSAVEVPVDFEPGYEEGA